MLQLPAFMSNPEQEGYQSMQPVINTQLQHQVTPPQQRIPGLRDALTSPAKMSTSRNTFALPEDVVSLSTDRSSILDNPVNRKPSVPVTSFEKKALRESFSVYA
jgi:hypothetical protein